MSNRAFLLGVAVALIGTFHASGQGNFTASTNGPWTTAGSWTLTSGSDGDGIPDANDTAIIPNTKTITMPTAATQQIASLTIQSGGTLNFNGAGGILQIFPSGGLLQVDNGGTIADNSTTTEIDFLNTASFVLNGIVQVDLFEFSGTNEVISVTGGATGTLLVGRFVANNAGVTIHLNNSGSFGSTGNPFTVSVANLTIDGTGTLSLGSLSGSLNLQAAGMSVGCIMNITKDLVLESANCTLTVTSGGNVSVGTNIRVGPNGTSANNGILTINNGATLSCLTDLIFAQGTGTATGFIFNNNGTFSLTGSIAPAGVVTGVSITSSNSFSVGSNVTLLAGCTNFSFTNSGPTFTIAGSVDTAGSSGFSITNSGTANVTGSININGGPTASISNSGTLTVGGSITNALASTTITNNANATFNIGGDITNAAVLNFFASGNTVNYTSNGGTDIEAPSSNNYFNLIVGGASNRLLINTTNILGNLTIQNTAVLNSNAKDINIAGNWSNTNAAGDPFVEGVRTVTFNGSTAGQQISNTGNAGGTTFNNLVFNNSFGTSPQITCNNNVIVGASGTLTMTKGNVNLNGTTFTIGTAIATPGTLSHSLASTAGWMYGGFLVRFYPNATAIAVNTAASLFPMGSSSDWRPFYLGQNNLSPGGSYKVSHTNTTTTTQLATPISDNLSPPNIILRHDAFWTGAKASGLASGTFAILAGGTGFGVITNVDHLRLCQVTTTSVGNSQIPNSGTTASPLINKVAMTSANIANNFYVGSTNLASPLPIALTDFTAGMNGNGEAIVNWVTATEIRNDYFSVERSADGEVFEFVQQVKGAVNSTSTRKYVVTDHSPYPGTSYYRLKQVDMDGVFVYSKIISLLNNGSNIAIIASPNPVRIGDDITVKINSPDVVASSNINFMFYDLLGRSLSLEYIQTDSNHFTIKTNSSLSPGIYILRVQSADLNRDFLQRIFLSH